MLANFPNTKTDQEKQLIIESYRQDLQGYCESAIIVIAERYRSGRDARKDKRFAPPLAEFAQAVSLENLNYDGNRRIGPTEARERYLQALQHNQAQELKYWDRLPGSFEREAIVYDMPALDRARAIDDASTSNQRKLNVRVA